MNHSILMTHLNHLRHRLSNSGSRTFTIMSSSNNPIKKLTTFTKLHNQMNRFMILISSTKLHNIRMLRQRRHDRHLSPDILHINSCS
ncbi:hypothetical protein HanRHA438_Chr09g0421621 [Helianthus annuus]|nr:hypothetical protein HanRHA438_Chr09g0421621 [Helianthus annuus]